MQDTNTAVSILEERVDGAEKFLAFLELGLDQQPRRPAVLGEKLHASEAGGEALLDQNRLDVHLGPSPRASELILAPQGL